MARRSAVARARRGRSRTPLVIGIVVVAVLAVVIGAVVFTQGSGSEEQASATIPVERSTVAYRADLDGSVVSAGRAGAPHTLEVYEDALCPACQQLEQTGGARIAKAVAGGTLRVRYHLVDLLEQRSRPAGYSSLAGGALLCGAENGIFPDLHTSLYAAQPEEGGSAWNAEQLVDLGNRLGAGPGYATCVRAGTYRAAVAGNFDRAMDDPALRRASTGGFGTPTLVLDGKLVETGDSRLDEIAPA